MGRIGVAVVVALGIIATSAGPASAISSDLGGTSWTTTNAACNIDGIDFASDGTAKVYDYMGDDDETAEWWTDGTKLTVEYDNWYGGIEGTIFDKGRIEAVETWRSEKNKIVHRDPCMFELED